MKERNNNMAEARIKVEFDKSGAEKEIKELQSRIEELKTEVDNMEKYATYKKCADEMFLVKKSFVDAGFTEEEASEMIKISLSSAFKTSLF